MKWEAFVLMFLYAFSAFKMTLSVGKERKPTEAGEAAIGVVLSIGLGYLVYRLGVS